MGIYPNWLESAVGGGSGATVFIEGYGLAVDENDVTLVVDDSSLSLPVAEDNISLSHNDTTLKLIGVEADGSLEVD